MSLYVKDFESLFVPIEDINLISKARNGILGNSQFRSVCWRYFLGCLSNDCGQWLEDCTRSRNKYQSIKQSHSSSRGINHDNIHIAQESKEIITKEQAYNNPKIERFDLASNDCDYKNVFRIIERDVIRTFPDMEFFRQSAIQETLVNVLFNYACEHPSMSYKQGMHELLATLLYVMHTDTQNCLINHQGGYANEVISGILEMRYIEHDLYHLFSALMSSVSTWYQNDEILCNQDGPNKGSSNQSRHDKQQIYSVLGLKLKMISENIVRNFDVELFNHLEALQIAPQIYGIRWMRLLFGREFEFLDLLHIWDAIICDETPMGLTDYIFASMLLTNRDELVNGDYTDCLNNLMRHQFKDTSHVINLALHLREPSNFPRPYQKPLIAYKAKQSTFKLDTSLISELSYQYISNKNKKTTHNSSSDTPSQALRYQKDDNRGGRHQSGTSTSTASRAQFTHFSRPTSSNSSPANKFLPKINKLVSSISQNIQERPIPTLKYEQIKKERPSTSSIEVNSNVRHSSNPTTSLSPKEYELREMQSSNKPARPLLGVTNRSGSSFNMSSESYEDLHSIVDYCWRLLSEQIDSLQRCLPNEKSLNSEDEIFVALAQLKKVRDVLKGSLRLEDELEATLGGNK